MTLCNDAMQAPTSDLDTSNIAMAEIPESTALPHDEYKPHQAKILQERISRGASCVVHRAMALAGQQVAVKQLCVRPMAGVKYHPVAHTPEHVLPIFAREVAALEKTRSVPGVVNMLHAQEHDPSFNGPSLHLEYCSRGELFPYISSQRRFPKEIARAFAKQLLEALRDCHDLNVYHCDVKAENILVREDWTLALTDFGHSRIDPPAHLRGVCGTQQYYPPEIVAGRGYDPRKVDVWCVGVVIFSMVTGIRPVQEARPGDWYYDRLVRGGKMTKFWNIHERYSGVAMDEIDRDFFQHILQPQADSRPEMRDILEHEWFSLPTMSQENVRACMDARFPEVPDV